VVTAKQIQAAKENVKKAQQKWQNMTSRNEY